MHNAFEKELTRKDFMHLARLHKSELPETGLLSECSTRFVAFFYESIYRLQLGILVVSKNKNPNGFALFIKDQNNYMKIFLKTRLFQIIRYPSSYRPILRRMFTKKSGVIFDYNAELTYIVVDRHKRNKGVAAQLLSRGEKRMRKEGIREYHVQVYDGNPAIRFYQKKNFKVIRKFDTEYGTKYLMKKQLVEPIMPKTSPPVADRKRPLAAESPSQ